MVVVRRNAVYLTGVLLVLVVLLTLAAVFTLTLDPAASPDGADTDVRVETTSR